MGVVLGWGSTGWADKTGFGKVESRRYKMNRKE
jgi:hypothetical protein